MLATALALATLACPLPAASATRLPISFAGEHDHRHTALRVCGHTLARGKLRNDDGRRAGTRIGQATAAGNRVAWIEERHARGERVATVTLARVGRRVRVLRRFEVHRQRARTPGTLAVLLTRRGDLAWSAGDQDGRAVVAVKQPGKRMRVLGHDPTDRFAIEDGRTLRWFEGSWLVDFFDLRRTRCPDRSRFRPYAPPTDRVALTYTVYGDTYNGVTVVRGCDLATGRDRELIQSSSDISVTADLTFVGLDRTWAVFHRSEVDRDGAGPAYVTVVDVVTGRSGYAYTYNGESVPRYPPPTSAVVTDRGVAGWIAGAKLYALARGRIVVIDQGALAGLHAEGDALVWTRDGVRRSFTGA